MHLEVEEAASPRSALIAAAFLALAALACAFGLQREAAAGLAAASAPLEEGRGAGWYATYGRDALARGEVALALEAARREAQADPGSAAAQTRLAHAATLAAGAPTREALAAMLAAYDAEPFPPAAVMIWRVDWALAHWASVPDPLAEAALSQVGALGRMGEHWEARVRWCRSAPVAAVAEAACATVPGVTRGLDL